MTVDEFYNFITQHMTAEQALKKLLATQIDRYEKLKIPDGELISPIFIIANAAMDLGWNIVLEGEEVSSEVRGLIVGTDDYLKENTNIKKLRESYKYYPNQNEHKSDSGE